MRRISKFAIVFIAFAAIAHANPTTKPASPLETYRTFLRALLNGDIERTRAVAIVADDLAPLLTATAEGIAAQNRLVEAAVKSFPSRKPVNTEADLDVWCRGMVEIIHDNIATVGLPGHTEVARTPRATLRLLDGQWKVDLATLPEGEICTPSELDYCKECAKAMDVLTDSIKAGKFTDEDSFKRAWLEMYRQLGVRSRRGFQADK